ncbi:uncharacterized protein LOC141817535 [Curcuma longa]|uniref:uncharacterized protein LOC141817535 n=1 Tax=Curcuma longa TaxID=136217 RepID=UPI003D9DEB40
MPSTPLDSPPAARAAIAPRAMEEGGTSLLPNLSFPFMSVQDEDVSGSRSDSVASTEEPEERRVLVLDDDDYGIQEVREKLMLHLQEAADRLNLMVPLLPKAPAPAPDPVASSASVPGTTASDVSAAPHWNLRTRSVILGAHEDQGRASRFTPATAETRLRPRKAERPKWPKFSLSLTWEEIEEDLYAITGRRPRKRPAAVQKKIDPLFPGSRLSEITEDSYRLPHER